MLSPATLTLLTSLCMAILFAPCEARCRAFGCDISGGGSSGDGTLRSDEGAIQSVFSSGRPPSEYQTGGIVWEGQYLGVRFLLRGLPNIQDGARVSKVEVFLETERLVMRGEENVIQLRLCAASPGEAALPTEPCVTESFYLERRIRQGLATWVLKEGFSVVEGGVYWVIIQGRATNPSTSISWLDGDVTFQSDVIRSAYVDPAGVWVLDDTNHTLPSLNVYASIEETTYALIKLN